MALLVDVGNTRLKWAYSEGGKLGKVAALSYQDAKLAGLEAAWSQIQTPRRVTIANVAGAEVGRSLAALVERVWRVRAEFVRTGRPAGGITIAYSDPDTLGVDRWLAMIAVRHAGMGPALVVDCGSAVTMDVIDPDGRHLGGLILPGLRAMWRALFANTAVPESAPEEAPLLLGTNTGECVAGGGLQAILGVIERTLIRVVRLHGFRPRIVLTGGDAALIGSRLELPHDLLPDLVLHGLTLTRN